MATKTISLRLEAYSRLVAARRYANESFSQVILRASWREQTTTAREYLQYRLAHGSILTEEALSELEARKQEQRPPEDKWTASFSKQPS